MISQWLESYAKWDTGDQRSFSVVLLITVATLLLVFCWWLVGIVREIIQACRRPRPRVLPEEFTSLKETLQRIQQAKTSEFEDINVLLRQIIDQYKPAILSPLGQDWRQMADDAEYQAKVQAESLEAMEQAKAPTNGA